MLHIKDAFDFFATLGDKSINPYHCDCSVPVNEVLEERATLMGLTSRPGLNPETGVKSLP